MVKFFKKEQKEGLKGPKGPERVSFGSIPSKMINDPGISNPFPYFLNITKGIIHSAPLFSMVKYTNLPHPYDR